MLPTTTDVFTQFGPSKYARCSTSEGIELTSDFSLVRSHIRTSCPAAPGVYGMVDVGGRLIYVGMSRNLRNRTQTYFSGQNVSHSLPDSRIQRKESRVAIRARRLVWQPTAHELLAQLREIELIRRFGPEMNVRGRSRRRLVFVYVSSEDAPRFRVGPLLPKGCRYHWGPVARSGRLSRAIEFFNRHFHLPDCSPGMPMKYGSQRNLFDLELHPLCLRGEMNRCLAPCAGVVSRSKYVAQLNRARAFLDGRDDSALVQLDAAIKAAVADRLFEQAAVLHSARTTLDELREQLLPRPDLLPPSFVYALERKGRTYWLATHEGIVVQVAPAPQSERGRVRWRTRFTRWRNLKMPILDDREGSELAILTSWFRRRQDELVHVMDFDTAELMCRD